MEDNPSHTWLDLVAHDYLIDAQSIEADNWDDYWKFLESEDQPPEDLQEKT